MALRLALLRRFCAKPVPAGNKAVFAAPRVGFTKAGFGKFFEEKFFWEKANVGPFFLLLFFTPSIYRSLKDFYWTRQLRKLNTEEVISDRYAWLKVQMIQDEVEAQLLSQVPSGGFRPLELGSSTPP